MDFLDIRAAAVQEFLWNHLVASDIRYDYSKADALKFVYDRIVAGEQWLVGDLDAGLAFRCVPANPYVLHPHIMGDMTKLREQLPLALAIAWRKGIRNVKVWTQHKAIAYQLHKFNSGWQGWTGQPTLPGHHWDGQQLHDLYIMTLEKPDA